MEVNGEQKWSKLAISSFVVLILSFSFYYMNLSFLIFLSFPFVFISSIISLFFIRKSHLKGIIFAIISLIVSLVYIVIMLKSLSSSWPGFS